VVNFRFQSLYLRCPFDNGLPCSRSSLDAVANESKSALLSGVEPGFLIILRCVIPIVCVTNEREENVVKHN